MVDVALRQVAPTPLAVARRAVARSEISVVMVPALDAVWAFALAHGLDTGHNVAVYVDGADGSFTAWFGVEITSAFDGDCSVESTAMPAGITAVATHVGPYDGLGDTHRAVREWCESNGHGLSGTSWEVYGDWTDDPAQLETTVGYVLA